MRIFSIYLFFLFILNCCFLQGRSAFEATDTSMHHVRRDSLFSISYRSLPALARYQKNYEIIRSVNDDYRPIEIDYSVESFLQSENYNDSSLFSSLKMINEKRGDGKISYSDIAPCESITEKELFYGVWRNQLTGSSSEAETKKSMTEGTNALLDLGYSDLGNDFLPFITNLMEEQHLFNYDNKRTRGLGSGSKGIVPTVEILNAMGSLDSRNKAGVCRDVHETARELLKTMCEVYYGRIYPNKKFDFDDYLFLQSWTTNKSQHVTLSLINPLNTKDVFELDWGRVIEKTNISGYNNGRLYGNTFRIWQYDKGKNRSVPIDFKRTEFGKILDDDILTSEEYSQFNGIRDEEFYSNIRYLKKTGDAGNINFSLGTYHPFQKYFLTSYYLSTRKKDVFKFLNHSYKFGMQAALHEDTRKKELLYPQADWQSAASLMGIPRVISKFETKPLKIAHDFTFNAFLNQQLDVFLIVNLFTITDSITNEISHSGDANLSFSNGFNIMYNSDNQRLISSITVQGRSCLLPKDIRLMTPNLSGLIPNIRFITPSFDIISNSIIKLNEKSNLSINGMLEFTNKEAIILSGSVSARIGMTRNLYIGTSAGRTDQIKGINYYWYPASRNWVDLRINYLRNTFSLSLLGNRENQASFNVSFMKFL